jgi:hypothetical protein
MRRVLGFVMVVSLSATTFGASGAFADTTTTTISGSSSATTTVPITKAPKATKVAPLTGLPDPTGVTKRRSALTIKIDNTPEAMPQYGINEADVVYEEIVEGGITRLAAIFNSQLPTEVGPLRSVRRTDRELVYRIGGIFAFSGGAQYALESIATAPVKLITESDAGAAMFRVSTRYPPHNLFANAVLLMAKGGKPKPPPPLFTYRSASTPARGPRVNAFTVGFASGYATSYLWNGTTRSWDRTIFGEPDVTATGVRVSPKNVIVMNVKYEGGVGVLGSYALLVGSGPAEVFSAGRVQRATWSRKGLSQRIVYKNSSGRAIALTPGQTWVELLDPTQHAVVTSSVH